MFVFSYVEFDIFCSCFGLSLVFWVSMEKHVKATQKLLSSLKALPSFDDVKGKHLSRLLALISKGSTIEVGQASELVDSLDGSVWCEQDLVSLKTAITQKITCEVTQPTRRPMQNYCALPRYLTQELWTFMQTHESQQARVEKTTSLAGSLGLRCPSETTTACIVWIACCAFRGQDVSDSVKFQWLHDYKPKIKKWLLALPVPVQYLTELPTDVQELPDVLRAVAFPTGHVPGVPAGFNLDSALMGLNRFPLRKTNALANNDRQELHGARGQCSDSAQASVWHAMGQILSSMAGGMRAPHSAVPDPNASREAVQRTSVPMLALTYGSAGRETDVAGEQNAAAGSDAVTALMKEAGDVPAHGGDESHVMASELQTLREAMGPGAAEPVEKSGQEDTVMKRPSGKKHKKNLQEACGATAN